MTSLNFDCKKCKNTFDSNVGKISFTTEEMRPVFEKDIVCPKCGTLSMDDVMLTELGQSQITEVDL
ncbi:MAG: hypothetical protein ACE5GV_01655 [Candidatus Scalindua sp.]